MGGTKKGETKWEGQNERDKLERTGWEGQNERDKNGDVQWTKWEGQMQGCMAMSMRVIAGVTETQAGVVLRSANGPHPWSSAGCYPCTATP